MLQVYNAKILLHVEKVIGSSDLIFSLSPTPCQALDSDGTDRLHCVDILGSMSDRGSTGSRKLQEKLNKWPRWVLRDRTENRPPVLH